MQLRPTRPESASRVNSSTTLAILTILPSAIASNWKSIGPHVVRSLGSMNLLARYRTPAFTVA